MPPSETALNSRSLAFAEALYEQYLADPSSVPEDWRAYFEALAQERDVEGAWRPGPRFAPKRLFDPGNGKGSTGLDADTARLVALQDRVDQLIRAYRVRGHLIAKFDPLGMPRGEHPELDPSHYDLHPEDFDLEFSTNTLAGHESVTNLGEIVSHLQDTYCRSIGAQFMHIDDMEPKLWLQRRMEEHHNRIDLGRPEQMRILIKLTDAVIFEEFIQKKYIGAKRFSLEGAESLIPLLDMAINRAGDQGLEEIVIGMPHRGRLNVLANIIGKGAREIFREFEDSDPELHLGRDDVKYHLGYSSNWITATGKRVHVSLCFNPSHLEFVNTVAQGRMRAKQDERGADGKEKGMVILIHGDAAFAGQGLVQETLNLSELEGFSTGGTLHVVVNNQIGFTSSPAEGRSSLYATAVGKMLQIPIFHVNGEDPEAVAQVVTLAMEFRRSFGRDAIIDMYCYRKHGHNEGDEPAFTHPVLYEAIRKRKSVRDSYLDRLMKLGGVSRGLADNIAASRRQYLDKELSAARSPEFQHKPRQRSGRWVDYQGGEDAAVPETSTGVALESLSELLLAQTRMPEEFLPHPKLQRFLDRRAEMARGERPLDWAAAEALALGSLAVEGHRIRFCGQDSARGTFSQRHATLHDSRDGRPHVPLQHLSPDQAQVEIINSPLSEAGVLGFEYGYSLDAPNHLVCWEAQFGDFVNAAQVIIDQFISSAEDKWRRLSGIVLLLPHGFEGQGPEHSSARLERFLTLAAEDNMQVVNVSSPAQYFHVLRRQVIRPWRKPLVVMTPKSLLRHPEAVSNLAELSRGGFKRILTDPGGAPAKRILLCSGKIYYELAARRAETGRDDVTILRLEQFYPLADETLRRALEPHPEGSQVFWVQEEPENMGAWAYLRLRFGEKLFGRWPFAGLFRPASASPATGFPSSHRLEQSRILDAAFEKR